MLRSNLVIDYRHLFQEIKTLHPIRAEKYSQILQFVKDCFDKGIRPTYRLIHQATGISSRTIAGFWKWMKEQGVGLKDIFISRVEEVAQKIQSKTKTTYRALRKKLGVSFSTISRAFKLIKNGLVFQENKTVTEIGNIQQNQPRPLDYNDAAHLFHALSPAEKARYFDMARKETGYEDERILEKFAIGIFANDLCAKTYKSSNQSKTKTPNKHNKPDISSLQKTYLQAESRVLEVYNSCLKEYSKKCVRPLYLAPSLSRKEKRALHKLLKMGFTLSDIESVIKCMADEWLNESRMIKSFKLQTILKPDYFRCYLNKAIIEASKEKSKYKPIKDGTRIQYNSKIYEVVDGLIHLEDGAIPPLRLWKLVRDGKAKIVSRPQ